MRNSSTLITALGLISLVLSGCAGTKDAVLPQDGPSMQAIYAQHMQKLGAREPLGVRKALGNRPVVEGAGSLYGYTRQAYNEIDITFPRLANPSLAMYVFPHLAGDEQVPVPGYMTTFPMYERIEYALPGEGPVRLQHK